MTEKEKARAGLLYNNNFDPQLIRERTECQKKCQAYNALPVDAAEQRKAALRKILGSTGERFCIEQPFHCDYGYNIHMGEGSFVNFDCVFLDLAPIRIGCGTLIGPKVQLLTAHHPFDAATRGTALEAGKPIVIGDHCWLGGGVIVCPGVTIGDRAVVGAGSVVTRDIPADSVAAGNPARIIRPL